MHVGGAGAEPIAGGGRGRSGRLGVGGKGEAPPFPLSGPATPATARQIGIETEVEPATKPQQDPQRSRNALGTLNGGNELNVRKRRERRLRA